MIEFAAIGLPSKTEPCLPSMPATTCRESTDWPVETIPGGEVFHALESAVRSYCRSFPAIFHKAEMGRLIDDSGRVCLDFFAGAGSPNYGHNNPALKGALIDHIFNDSISHGLDMATSAKRTFLETFDLHILRPRRLPCRLQFTGPTGANAVEAALKIARKATGRWGVIAFTNGFHGVTLGTLSVTANPYYRRFPGTRPADVTFMPYEGIPGAAFDTIEYIDKCLSDSASGDDRPAAFIVETVQEEGGMNVASAEWQQRLCELARKHGIILVVNDVQTRCGRTGPLFSFERTKITPDIMILSKSLSGYGPPLALVLIRPDLDVWEPGENNRTFPGRDTH